MSGPKHTPQPWRAMLDDSNPDEPRLAVMAGNHIVSETVIHGPDEASKREAAANTRLIAAAPRLAAALKDALAGLEAARQHHGMNTGILEDKARAALREAGVEL